MTFSNHKYKEIQSFIKNNAENIVKTIVISKSHPFSSIQKAINSGIRVFGENKVQEAIYKFSKLKVKYEDIQLHLTGSLQTNKTKDALNIFDVFHTLDREKLALQFNKYFIHASSKKFFIQVNIGKENNKSGIWPEQTNDFVNYCLYELKLPIIGLMCIPPIDDDPQQHFSTMNDLALKNNLNFLSMGMSSDYKCAILNGATHIRIGTLLFGSRTTYES